MKLKLEIQGSVPILVVTENLNGAGIEILRSGLTKLFQANRKTAVLDLCALKKEQIEATALPMIADLPKWAETAQARVLVASPIEGVGSMQDRAAALASLDSPLQRFLDQEASLRNQVQSLSKQKAVLEERLKALGGANDATQIRRENSDLKIRLGEMEKVAARFLKGRKDAPENIVGKKLKLLQDALNSSLEGVPAKPAAAPPPAAAAEEKKSG